jgi:hypothetical protein
VVELHVFVSAYSVGVINYKYINETNRLPFFGLWMFHIIKKEFSTHTGIQLRTAQETKWCTVLEMLLPLSLPGPRASYL